VAAAEELKLYAASEKSIVVARFGVISHKRVGRVKGRYGVFEFFHSEVPLWGNFWVCDYGLIIAQIDANFKLICNQNPIDFRLKMCYNCVIEFQRSRQ
jgi:hypothetical protein